MKWVNHKIITGCLATLATGDLVFAGLCTAGAIIPDLVEGEVPEEGSFRYNSWRKAHRQTSHWFIPYAIAAAASWTSLSSAGVDIGYPAMKMKLAASVGLHGLPVFSLGPGIVAGYCGLGICLGALMHIAEDAITGRVPSINPQRRIGHRFMSVGSIPEYLLSISTLGYTTFRFLG